ncbi:hypothetical protein [Sphingomonas sp. ID0503]|uniref:hypothetical protein n=1 Tax=Sphingomonas sp. ID0503 TaxID=3399691 RepID=UPI003AFAE953
MKVFVFEGVPTGNPDDMSIVGEYDLDVVPRVGEGFLVRDGADEAVTILPVVAVNHFVTRSGDHGAFIHVEAGPVFNVPSEFAAFFSS